MQSRRVRVVVPRATAGSERVFLVHRKTLRVFRALSRGSRGRSSLVITKRRSRFERLRSTETGFYEWRGSEGTSYSRRFAPAIARDTERPSYRVNGPCAALRAAIRGGSAASCAREQTAVPAARRKCARTPDVVRKTPEASFVTERERSSREIVGRRSRPTASDSEGIALCKRAVGSFDDAETASSRGSTARTARGA